MIIEPLSENIFQTKPILQRRDHAPEILKTLLATKFTIQMTIGLTFENIHQPPPPFRRQNLAPKILKSQLATKFKNS